MDNSTNKAHTLTAMLRQIDPNNYTAALSTEKKNQQNCTHGEVNV